MMPKQSVFLPFFPEKRPGEIPERNTLGIHDEMRHILKLSTMLIPRKIEREDWGKITAEEMPCTERKVEFFLRFLLSNVMCLFYN